MAAPKSLVGAPRLGVGPQGGQPIVAPTLYPGSTDYGVLDANSGSYGNTPSSAPVEHVDQYGTKFRYVDYGNGTGEWLEVLPGGQLVKPGDAAEAANRGAWAPTPGASIQGTRSAGNVGATPGNNYFTPAGGQRPVNMPSVQGTARMGVPAAPGGMPQPNPQQAGPNYSQLYSDSLLEDEGSNNRWYSGQTQRDQDYLGQLGGIVNGANAADQDSLNRYRATADQSVNAINAIQPVQWQDFNSNPQDVARQQAAYDWAQSTAYGGLDYTAQQANYQNANYQTYQAQQAQLALAQLHQYASNPQDVQRQLSGLGNIQKDIETGGAGQRKILEQIYQDIQSGGTGQRDAIERLKQELSTGGADQREVMEKYKALSNPEVTAQERYLAEIARRSFEAQDRGSREAVLSDQSARGVRSGASEIASALGNQERFGQDRTLAELGLQANAVQRSMVALGGWQQSADSLRAAQQNGLAMYTQANNALRAAQQQGMAMAADEENALRQAQQQGLAMYQQAADSIRQMNDTVGLSNTGWANANSIANAGFSNENSQFNANANNMANQFNANAYNMNQEFNANAYNQNSQFNANANNNAMANNQNARVQGGVAMNNTANSIRGMNDAIGMFNTEGSQITQRFNAGMAFDKATSIYGIGQDTFNNETGVTDTAANRSGALASSTWSIPSTTEAENRRLRAEAEEKRRVDIARVGGFTTPPPLPTFKIPGVGV